MSVDFNLALTLTGPRGDGAAFGGMGNVSGTAADIRSGIGGFRGHICLPIDGLPIPYYSGSGLDGLPFTWQI